MPGATAAGYPYPLGSDQLGDTDLHIKALADKIQAMFHPAVVAVGGGGGAPAFAGAWANQGGAFLPVGYRKVGQEIYLEGHAALAAGGAATIFTLPVGFRPAAEVRFACPVNNTAAVATVSVTAAGVVATIGAGYPASGNLGLNGIRFRQAN